MKALKKIAGRKIKNFIKIYRGEDIYKAREDDIRYWKTQSIKTKVNTIYELWSNYCWMKGLEPNEQRLQRVLKVTKIPQG